LSDALDALASAISASRRTVVLTGAGVSTESGIPDFRSDSGVWSRADPMEVGSIDGFRENPGRFYDFWSQFFEGLHAPDGSRPRPNAMHRLLAALERNGKLGAVITQNVDGLHQDAGSERVLEAHGNWQRTRCTRCGNTSGWREVMAETPRGAVPSCELCGGTVRPDVVLFGELLGSTFEEARDEVKRADLFIAMGTSLEVAPVSSLPSLAKEHGARVVMVNRDPTLQDRHADLLVRGELGSIAAQLARRLELQIG
jgi:NAD-dependent deacetylase